MTQPLDTRFPIEVQEIWAELYSDVVWLHGRWIIYRQLFGTNKARVDLLNETTGTITGILQDLLLHDVQLSISKIGDPPGNGSHTNLTLTRLQLELRDAGHVDVADSMDVPLAEFEDTCKNLRHRRNKWIAHSDLQTSIGSRAMPLLGPSRKEIETALAALRKVMNTVELRYTGSRSAYEHFNMNEDGEHLILALLQAKRYRELIKDGMAPKENLSKRFLGGT